MAARDARDLVASALHLEIAHPQRALAGIVVENGDGPVGLDPTTRERLDQLAPNLAGAEDDGPLGVLPRLDASGLEEASSGAKRDHPDEGQRHTPHRRANWHVVPEPQEIGGHCRGSGDHNGAAQRPELLKTADAPDVAVEGDATCEDLDGHGDPRHAERGG